MKINKKRVEELKKALSERKGNNSKISESALKKRLARQQESLEKQYEKRLRELQEAEKLKNMTDKERSELKIKKLEEELQAVRNEQLVNQFKIELTTKGLKPEFADYLNVNDAEKTKKALDFLSGFKQELESSYLEKIKGLEEQLKNSNARGSVPKGAYSKPSADEGSIFAAPFKNKE